MQKVHRFPFAKVLAELPHAVERGQRPVVRSLTRRSVGTCPLPQRRRGIFDEADKNVIILSASSQAGRLTIKTSNRASRTVHHARDALARHCRDT